MAEGGYRGYIVRTHKAGGLDIFVVPEEEGKGIERFCGWAPNPETAKELIDGFAENKITPWYESEAGETLLGGPEDEEDEEE